MDETLNIREIVNAYLLYNGLTVSYMSRATRIPNSTLRDWLNGKINISAKNLSKVKQFLKGDFLLDVSTIINELLLQKEIAADENRTDWQRSWQAYKDLKWEIQRITESILDSGYQRNPWKDGRWGKRLDSDIWRAEKLTNSEKLL